VQHGINLLIGWRNRRNSSNISTVWMVMRTTLVVNPLTLSVVHFQGCRRRELYIVR
jgi:hypothetical protein